jgi:hypothetical protein
MDEAMIGFRDTPADWGYPVKHAAIVEHARRFGLDALFETGTYLGITVSAMLPHFSDIYSVELGADLYRKAQETFKGNPKVHLFWGDSGEVLGEVLPSLGKRLLFWLDAHWSMGITARGKVDTPILEELRTIFSFCPDCAILIDDAREFKGAPTPYPSLPDLRSYVLGMAPGWEFEAKDDIVRIYRDRK